MIRQIRVKKLLVQLYVLLVVAQSKFNPSKHEIRLLSEYVFLPIQQVPPLMQCYVILQQQLNCLSVKKTLDAYHCLFT